MRCAIPTPVVRDDDLDEFMATPRFFVTAGLAPMRPGHEVRLPDAVAHHAVRVVRLAAGDALVLFDGTGGEYRATLASVDRRGASAHIVAFDAVERESSLAVTLAQAIAANDAMDATVRKAVELGAASIQPLVSARSAPLPDGERGARRLAHWQQVAIAACEQCGRNRVPEVAPPRSLASWLADWRGSAVVLAPGAASSLATLAPPVPPVAVLIGPEGGLTDREVHDACARGFAAVRLGPRILRTDTAGVAVLAALQALWGDLR